jgi:hypothetical protein
VTAPFLPVIKTITNSAGAIIGPVEELRIGATLTATVVTGDGPDRIELGGASGTLTGLTADAPLALTGTTVKNLSLPAVTHLADGRMIFADKVKLDAIGVGAAVVSVGVTSPIVNTGTVTNPVLGASAASGAAAGSMSAAHYTLLAGADKNATPNALFGRDSSGDGAVRILTAAGLIVGTTSSTFAADRGCTPGSTTTVSASTVTLRGIDGEKQTITIGGNTTFAAPTNFANGATLKIRIRQGGAGSFGATWNGAFKFPNAPTGVAAIAGTLLATTTGDIDFFIFEHDTVPTSRWDCVLHTLLQF